MRPARVILVVMGNEQELSVLKMVLWAHKYRVLAAATALDAMMKFAEAPVVDLVLADFALPDRNGAQLVKRLKRLRRGSRAILLGDPDAIRAENPYLDAMLARRDCTPEELLERIKVMCARKRRPKPKQQLPASISQPPASRQVSESASQPRKVQPGRLRRANMVLGLQKVTVA